MPRLHTLVLSLGLTVLLSGCLQLSGGKGSSPDDVTPNAVAGDAIEVTALDGTAPEEGTDAAAPPPAADPGEKLQTAAPAAAEEPAPVEAAPEPAPQPDLTEAVPAAEKSDQQKACEKKKGEWIKSVGETHTCVFSTKDAGKSCTAGRQCEGDCLARSGTCSPVKPLLGCNDILQDDGTRVTLCID